jgi:putative sterol carrier protein
MTTELFSEDWATAWAKEINASDAYRVAALKWESGFVLVMQPDPQVGVREPRAVFVALARGECTAARVATGEDLERAPYVLRASPAVWRQVLGGDLEPVGAMMLGLMDLSRGSLADLTPWVGAAKELLSAACRVECSYPEGVD